MADDDDALKATAPDTAERDAPDAHGADGGPRSRAADALSTASDFGAVWVLVAATQVLTRRSTPASAARRLGAAGLVSLVLTRWLKHRYAIPRTAVTTRRTTARTPSSDRFPSGHTLAAFTSAIVVPRTPHGRAVALCVATAVGWARVRVGHHRPVDVVAGAAVGTLAGSVIAAVLPTS